MNTQLNTSSNQDCCARNAAAEGRMFLKRSAFVLAAAIVLTGFTSFSSGCKAYAQAAAPSATAAPDAQASASAADPLPAADPKYFTADLPTKGTVESFLHVLWGYDVNRVWRIAGIEKTAAAGVSKVTVYVVEKGANAQVQTTSFYVMPDGKHAIADKMISFGADPFADTRALLKSRANGPALGAAGKDVLLVEFADLQCPHCKEAQGTMKQLAADFPQARIVSQLFPLVSIHPAAFQAAAEGFCVAQKSNDAFFLYSDAVYNTQEALTPEGTSKTLADAVTKAGQDPAAIAACAGTPEIKNAVNASIKLATEAGVDQTPMLAVNGRVLPLNGIPYDTLKKIIIFQASLDGVKIDPPPPSLSTLPK